MFSLGATIYQFLAKKPPFDGLDCEIIEKKHNINKNIFEMNDVKIDENWDKTLVEIAKICTI
jgi:serine/threonine protein kinase